VTILPHQRFLWPRKALGSPVRIRRAPKTPKAGSNTVASTGPELCVGIVVFVAVALSVVVVVLTGGGARVKAIVVGVKEVI
jgi:hypothetical protein